MAAEHRAVPSGDGRSGATRAPWQPQRGTALLGVAVAVALAALPAWFAADRLFVRPLRETLDQQLARALDAQDTSRAKRLAAARALLAPLATPPARAPWAQIGSAIETSPARLQRAYELMLENHPSLVAAVASGRTSFVRLLDGEGRVVPLASSPGASNPLLTLRSLDDRLAEFLWERAARPTSGNVLILGTHSGAWQLVEQKFIGEESTGSLLAGISLLTPAAPPITIRAWVEDHLSAPPPANSASDDGAPAHRDEGPDSRLASPPTSADGDGAPLSLPVEEALASELRGRRLAGLAEVDSPVGAWRVLVRPLGARHALELAAAPLVAVEAERSRIALALGLGTLLALALGTGATWLLLRAPLSAEPDSAPPER